MFVLVSLVISLLIEGALLAWTGHRAYQWLISAQSCQIAPSSMNLKYCGSFVALVGPWIAVSLVIPAAWLAAGLRGSFMKVLHAVTDRQHRTAA
jgi:hypothetical protein